MANNGQKLLSQNTLDQFKYEIASELGLTGEIQRRGWADMPSRAMGAIGGNIGGRMVRVMIRYAEEALARGEQPPPV